MAWIVIDFETRKPIRVCGDVTHPNTIGCERCGQAIRHVVTVKDEESLTVLKVGRDCAVTLEGGPALAEIRKAERAYELAEWERENGPRIREEARMREERLRMVAAQNAEDFSSEMAECRAIIASPRTTDWEKDYARGILGPWERGTRDHKVETKERAILDAALRTVRAPESVHAHKPGDKFSAEVTFHRIINPTMDSRFPAWRYIFLADDGSVYTWKTATDIVLDKDAREILCAKFEGKRFMLKGTVKANSEYRGTKQTEVLRCKVAFADEARTA